MRFCIALLMIGLTSLTLASQSADAPKIQLEQADQQKVQAIYRYVSDLSKDIELAQAKIDIAQAKVQRVNEVLIPELVGQFRETYKAPDTAWAFDMTTMTFTHR